MGRGMAVRRLERRGGEVGGRRFLSGGDGVCWREVVGWAPGDLLFCVVEIAWAGASGGHDRGKKGWMDGRVGSGFAQVARE